MNADSYGLAGSVPNVGSLVVGGLAAVAVSFAGEPAVVEPVACSPFVLAFHYRALCKTSMAFLSCEEYFRYYPQLLGCHLH